MALRAFIEGNGMLALLPVGAFVCAPTGEIVFFNEAASSIWGRRPERFDPLVRFSGAHRLIQRDGTEIAPEDAPMAVALRTGSPVDGVRMIVEQASGELVHVESQVRLVDDASGSRLAAVEVIQRRLAVPLSTSTEIERLTRAVREISRQTAAIGLRSRELSSEVVRLDELVDLAALAREAAARCGATSVRVEAVEPLHVITDRGRVDDVLRHLLRDALGRGGDVDLRVRRSPDGAEIAVRNQGATFTMTLPLTRMS